MSGTPPSGAWRDTGGPPRTKAMPKPAPLATFPRYPRRVADALHALAESNPTPAEYERKKAQILEGDHA